MSTEQTTHSPANLPGGADKWERVRSGNSQVGDLAVYPSGNVYSVTHNDDGRGVQNYWENNKKGQLEEARKALVELFDSTARVRFDADARPGWVIISATSAVKRQHEAMLVAKKIVKKAMEGGK